MKNQRVLYTKWITSEVLNPRLNDLTMFHRTTQHYWLQLCLWDVVRSHFSFFWFTECWTKFKSFSTLLQQFSIVLSDVWPHIPKQLNMDGKKKRKTRGTCEHEDCYLDSFLKKYLPFLFNLSLQSTSGIFTWKVIHLTDPSLGFYTMGWTFLLVHRLVVAITVKWSGLLVPCSRRSLRYWSHFTD